MSFTTLALEARHKKSVPAAAGTGTTAVPSQPAAILARISVPSIGVQKTLRVSTADLVWTVKKQITDKVASDIKDVLNFGLFLPAVGGKLGKFLDEKKDLSDYQLESNVSVKSKISC